MSRTSLYRGSLYRGATYPDIVENGDFLLRFEKNTRSYVAY